MRCDTLLRMPRTARIDIGDEIYHVINRANGRAQIFNTPNDYRLFEELMEEAKALTDMRIFAYEIMPNHWHLVLSPRKDGDLGLFMHQLTNSHTRNVRVSTGTVGTGHLYQGRYKSFLIDSENYLLAVIKYTERNSVRAKLVNRCEDWQWGSSWRRIHGTIKQKKLLEQTMPIEWPEDYISWVNFSETSDELNAIRQSVNKSMPYGREYWVEKMVINHHLETTLRNAGRPKKN